MNKNYNYSIEDLKEELIKMEGWRANAKHDKDLMTINYLINIQKKMIQRLEEGC